MSLERGDFVFYDRTVHLAVRRVLALGVSGDDGVELHVRGALLGGQGAVHLEGPLVVALRAVVVLEPDPAGGGEGHLAGALRRARRLLELDVVLACA